MKPNKGEKQEEFVARCMESLVEEYPDQEEREAVAIKLYQGSDKVKLEKKQFRLEVKAEPEGVVTAVFAKTGVVDRGGDVILEGAFDEQEVIVSSFNHGSTMSQELPVGKGRIYEKGDEAIAELKFFMSTDRGREHFEVIKELGGLQEYSFGFLVTKNGELTDEFRKAGAFRVIEKVKVFEVSPVLVGEGIDTRTLAVKSHDEDKEDLREEAAALYNEFTSLSRYLK